MLTLHLGIASANSVTQSTSLSTFSPSTGGSSFLMARIYTHGFWMAATLVFAFAEGARQSAATSPLVSAPAGKFSGYRMTSSQGRDFWAFSGIRYAKAPIGNLRFKAPVPAAPLRDKQDAVTEGPKCSQLNTKDFKSTEGSEDCLFLNVYTHDVKRRAAVMLWIHGGGYESGSGSKTEYGPELLMNEDIVLVTINYRLSVLGFASLGNKLIPGNFGLKDQEEAIRWTKKNIRRFGGDPDNITIFGESAGAGSVSLLLRGRAARNVKRGIAMSGSALCPWTIARKTREATLDVAKALECDTESDEKTLECLSSKPAQKIILARLRVNITNEELTPFVPVVERGGPVPADPWENPPSDRALMISHTTAEGNFFLSPLLGAGPLLQEGLYNAIRKNFDKLIPKALYFEFTAKNPTAVSEAIRKYYLSDGIDAKNNASLQQAVSDGLFNYPVYKDVVRSRGPVYFYVFDYLGAQQINISGQGPAHAQDLPFIFRRPTQADVSKGTDEDRQKSEQMVKMFADFAKGQDPTPANAEGSDWGKKSANGGGYLLVSRGNPKIYGPTWEKERIEFWSKLPFRPDNN
ncbi:Carboxylesterase [Nesidiocoris tenuis]|uniref:Carboxylic ester hydrolase n=1 Tax=Nesidiocoris tenuis TaxID=355587 RepID=A0ABN7B9I5_9HEMI|nr:Carboxylesterase [Nesidiocoris tenuis]